MNISSGPYLPMAKLDISKHALVPKHEKASDKERKDLMERYGIEIQNLPIIFESDPAIASLKAKEGEIIKITRLSMTAGRTIFYRRIVHG